MPPIPSSLCVFLFFRKLSEVYLFDCCHHSHVAEKQTGLVLEPGPATEKNERSRKLSIGLLDDDGNVIAVTELMGSSHIIDVKAFANRIGFKIS